MRSIDHCVLVAKELPDARERYRRMGFTVAPDGVHPFGTHNANMYFRSGPMIETLAIADRTKYLEALEAGNTFVRNDAAFRGAHGDDGFSQIVATSTDADRDHLAFLERGVSGGAPVAFSRKFERPDGGLERLAVKLAFAIPPQATSGYFFVCENVVTPEIDRSSLLDHENGATGARSVISCTRTPSAYLDFYSDLFGSAAVVAGDNAVDCALPNGRVSIATPEGLARDFGVEEPQADADLRHRGVIFGVPDLSRTEALFTRNQVSFKQLRDRLITPPASERGFFFGFEQAPV
jgi:hypothetical protein